MQICHLSKSDAERIQHPGFVPDCHFHDHLSRKDADQAVADGRVRFISRRAVVAVGPAPLSGHWYDEAVGRPGRNLGTARSGAVRTMQLLDFLPRGLKHKVRNIKARGARRRRLVTTKTANNISALKNRTGGHHDELV